VHLDTAPKMKGTTVDEQARERRPQPKENG